MNVARFRPLKPYAHPAREQPHAPQAADRRRQGRPDRRRRDRRGVDGQRAGPRPLARHARARHGPGRCCGLQGAFAENWLEATGRRARRRRPPARPRARPRRRRADAGRALRAPGSATRTPRRSTSSPSPPRASGCTSPRRTSRRGRRSPRRSATRPTAASTSASSCPAATSTRGSCGPPAARSTRSSSTAACASGSTARPCCTRRRSSSTARGPPVGSVNFDNRSFQLHDEVTLCVQSRSFAARAGRAVRARPRGVRGDRAGPVGGPGDRCARGRSGRCGWRGASSRV